MTFTSVPINLTSHTVEMKSICLSGTLKEHYFLQQRKPGMRMGSRARARRGKRPVQTICYLARCGGLRMCVIHGLLKLKRQWTLTIWILQLPNDNLQLRQPVHISSLTFLSHSFATSHSDSSIPTSSASKSSSHHIVTGSRHGHVRRYDTRAARKPVANWTGFKSVMKVQEGCSNL